MRNTETGNVRYLAGYFSNEHDLKTAAAEAHLRGFDIYDIFSPFPIHGIDKVIGLRTSRLTWVAFAGGVAGLATAIFLQVWTSAYNWPLVIGGKPFSTLLLFVPVMFELTVLFAGLSAIGALFWVCGLWPFSGKESFEGVNNDRFVLVLRQSDSSMSADRERDLLVARGADEILEGDRSI